jgi:peroxiredoxin
MRDDIIPGSAFPDYELPDQNGTLCRLSDIQSGSPMILVLSRGPFCPKDRLQLRGLVKLAPAFEVGYTSIATIATDRPDTLRAWRAGVEARWPFLSDAGRIVQKDLQIEEYTDPSHNPLIPHTFVLAPRLEIYKLYNGYWFWGRPSNEDLRQDLRAVTLACRPDWDITLPHLRANWLDDQSLHYPYERATAQKIFKHWAEDFYAGGIDADGRPPSKADTAAAFTSVDPETARALQLADAYPYDESTPLPRG